MEFPSVLPLPNRLAVVELRVAKFLLLIGAFSAQISFSMLRKGRKSGSILSSVLATGLSTIRCAGAPLGSVCFYGSPLTKASFGGGSSNALITVSFCNVRLKNGCDALFAPFLSLYTLIKRTSESYGTLIRNCSNWKLFSNRDFIRAIEH